MTLRIVQQSEGAEGKVHTLYVPSHPRPAAARRHVVVDLSPGESYCTLITTHGDSGVIKRRPAAAADEVVVLEVEGAQ